MAMTTLSPIAMTLNKIIKAVKRPRECLHILGALLKGCYYIVLYRITNDNIRISFPFFAYAPVRISGPGTVVIGKSTRALLNVYRGLTIITGSPGSMVEIGGRCSLGGLTIRCAGRISMGDRVMTAFSLIQDSYPAHWRGIGDCNNNVATGNEIIIGNNVWISGQCIVLGGSRIGNDSVLSFGTCCHDLDVGDYRLVVGNPAKRSLPIEKVLQLKGLK